MKRTRTNSLWRALGFGAGEPARRSPRPPPRDRQTAADPPRAHPREVRRPGERLRPPVSPLRDAALRDLSRRERARASMDFAAGAASGAGFLLALAGVVFVLFPNAWPRPAVTERAAIAALPQPVAPSIQQQASLAPMSAPGRGDAMPMIAMQEPQTAAGAGAAVTKTTAPGPQDVATEMAALPKPAAPPLPAAGEPPPVEQVSLAGAHAVYLSSFPDRELAESGWQILERRYAKGLTGLKPEIVAGKDQSGKRVWRLFAGPLRSQADAAQRCRALSFGSVNCKPADFTRGATGATGAWEG